MEEDQKSLGDVVSEGDKREAKNFISKLLIDLKKEVEIEDVKILSGKFKSPVQADSKLSSPQFGDDLRYLNLHWGDWNVASNFSSHRRISGFFFVRIKRKIQSYLFSVIFKDYIESQKSFNMNLVKFCNNLSRYTDERDKQIFWETIKKLDSEVSLIEERYDTLFAEVISLVNSKK